MTRSPLASFLFKGLATKHTTVKWTIKKYSLATVFVLQLRNIAVKFSSDQKHEVTDLI